MTGIQCENRIMTYKPGDHIKVEFRAGGESVGEWMWVRVTACDDARQLVFGVLDNTPIADSTGRLKVGTELAISFDKIREHKPNYDLSA